MTKESNLLASQLTPEKSIEVERLHHGVAVLDLFDKEDAQTDFIRRAAAVGSETREAILQGPSFEGDELKLARAVIKARYGVEQIKRQAMVEHAAYLGIDARIVRKVVDVSDPDEEKRLAIEHGQWRRDFASARQVKARESMRVHLESQIEGITTVGRDEAHSDNAEKIEVVLGPYVNIEERARLLVEAINIMAHRSMLSGFGLATKTDHDSPEIWNRYENGKPRIEERAANKRERQLQEVKKLFWLASGFPALRKHGTMKERELRARSSKMWEDFTAEFEHPPNQKNRMKVRKQLKKILPEFTRPKDTKEVGKTQIEKAA